MALRSTFLVDAGAVENAWAPVVRALQPYCAAKLTGSGANFLMAQLVYQLRWFAGVDEEIGRRAVAQLKDHLVAIRAAISRELITAQSSGELRVRREFAQIVNKLLLPRTDEFLLLSTNWDLVVEGALRELLATSRRDGV